VMFCCWKPIIENKILVIISTFKNPEKTLFHELGQSLRGLVNELTQQIERGQIVMKKFARGLNVQQQILS
jgi:hypothetical protein